MNNPEPVCGYGQSIMVMRLPKENPIDYIARRRYLRKEAGRTGKAEADIALGIGAHTRMAEIKAELDSAPPTELERLRQEEMGL